MNPPPSSLPGEPIMRRVHPARGRSTREPVAVLAARGTDHAQTLTRPPNPSTGEPVPFVAANKLAHAETAPGPRTRPPAELIPSLLPRTPTTA